MTLKRWHGFILMGAGIVFFLISTKPEIPNFSVLNIILTTMTTMVYITFAYVGLTSKGAPYHV